MAIRNVRMFAVVVALALAGCQSRSGPPSAPRPVSGPLASDDRPESTSRPKSPEKPSEPSIRLSPATATLEPGDVGLQLRVEGRSGPHESADLTSAVAWSVEPSGIVAVEPGGYVRPLRAGTTKVWAGSGVDRVAAEIEVAPRDAAERPWDFAADIVPIFTRYGCNTGGCHGKAGGQNGFHLSLFGYDPDADFQALTREADARRLDRMEPALSLLIRKATGRTPHGGGLRLPADSDAYRTLIAWIAAGAPRTRGATHGALADVRVEPPNFRLDEPGPCQFRVVARFEDGHERDVTRLATYRLNDDRSASTDDQGRLALKRRAEVDLIVRYQSRVLSARVATPIHPDLDFDFAGLPRRNFIDEELFRRLESLKVPPSPPADDAAFLRRISLDLTGQLPLPGAIKDYVASDDPDKRSKLVAALMESPEFFLFWRLKFGDLLQISQARFGNGYGPYEYWLNTRLQENAPWDQMVRELLTSLGDPTKLKEGGPVNYARDGNGDPRLQAELTAQRFLGIRLHCAQCHDHPFDVWTQDDYYGLAAIFARIETGAGGGAPGMMMGTPIVRVNPEGTIEHLRTGEAASPRLLDGTPVEVASGDDPRRALADWMTAPENPYFARAFANWAWAQFFGKGVADPPDDLSAANPAVHPELLDALAEHFVASGFDIRDLIRTIASSEAYALSSIALAENARDTRLFSHQLPRPLTAHQMVDAICQATDVFERFPNRSPRARTRAIEIFDPGTPSTILDTFGRCSRTNGCSPISNPTLSLRQALLLIGGDAIDGKVSALNGYLSNLLTLDPSPSEIVEFLYYRTLCRPPTDAERSTWTAVLSEADSLSEAAEDLFWALLNSKEFAFNH